MRTWSQESYNSSGFPPLQNIDHWLKMKSSKRAIISLLSILISYTYTYSSKEPAHLGLGRALKGEG
jgi:hypothetical protein